MQIAKLGFQRATLRLVCALAATCSVPGCISYTAHTAKDQSTYEELAIASGLGVVEIGGALGAGYLAGNDEPLNAEEQSRAVSMMSFTAGVLLADAIVALVIYTFR